MLQELLLLPYQRAAACPSVILWADDLPVCRCQASQVLVVWAEQEDCQHMARESLWSLAVLSQWVPAGDRVEHGLKLGQSDVHHLGKGVTPDCGTQ